MVYGLTLRLPGEFVCPTTHTCESPADYVAQLKSAMQQASPTSSRHHPQRAPYISQALETCTHILVRHYAVKRPLQQPYDGPYKVLQRAEKFYTLDIKGKPNTVSLDCLKPAYLDSTHQISPPQPTQPPSAPTFRALHYLVEGVVLPL